jgi:predicted permease
MRETQRGGVIRGNPMKHGLEILLQDIRYTFRSLRKSPGFTIVAVLTAALGVGANTAVFSMINSILLHPLAYEEPERLVNIKESVPAVARLYPTLPVNGRHFEAWQRQCSSFESIALIDSTTVTLTGGALPERVASRTVTWNYFHVLGVSPIAGRTFVPDEGNAGANRVAVVTDALWHRHFGAESFHGQEIVLDGTPYVVIGILSPSFRVPEKHSEQESPVAPELFTPLVLDYAALPAMGDFNYQAIGRVRRGIPVEKALSELNLVQAELGKSAGAELQATMEPLRDSVVGNVRRELLLLFGAVGVVLLIGCTNLANLLLERSSWRVNESSIRSALGASRTRLLQQMLTESICVALLGGVFGLIMAQLSLNLLIGSAPLNIPRLDEIRLDWTVLAFATAISVLSGLAFGILPGLLLAKSEPIDALKTRGTLRTSQQSRLREFLVGAEVAMTLVLVTTGMLLLISFIQLLHIDKGFETRHVITAGITLPSARYSKPENIEQCHSRILAEMSAIPGVEDVGITSRLPLQGNGAVSPLTIEGDSRPVEQRPQADYRFVSSGYLSTLGIRLQSGRMFDQRDRNRNVAVITEATALRLWPGRSALGQHFSRFNQTAYEVIGIAADTRSIRLQEQPSLMVYLPYWDRALPSISLVIRTTKAPHVLASALRTAIARVDAEVPVSRIQTMEQLLDGSVAQRRFQMALIVLFAVTSLLLGCIGIYGVLAQTVARKTGEIGIRIALGASKSNIQRLVLRWGMRPVIVGSAIGIAGSLLTARLLRSLIFGVSATDPIMLLGAMFVVLATGILACYLPARRASSIELIAALRAE